MAVGYLFRYEILKRNVRSWVRARRGARRDGIGARGVAWADDERAGAGRRVGGHSDGRRMIIDDLWRQSNIARRPLGTA
jgi:hypothetical protein